MSEINWEDIAEIVKMPEGVAALTLFDGRTVEVPFLELRDIVENYFGENYFDAAGGRDGQE